MTSRKSQKPPRPTVRSAVENFDAAPMLPETVALLALSAPSQPRPAARIKRALLARIRASRADAPASPAGWRFESARSPEGWLAAFPGVRFKPLSVDAARDVALVLVELQPGTRFPDHPHEGGAEEFLLLSGDIRSGGRTLTAGDYYHAAEGTEHTEVTSRGGCTALLSLRATSWQRFRASLAA